MNFRESMIKAMTSRGMFESQAVTVIDSYISSDESNPMMDRWYENTSYYPEAMQSVLWMGVKDYAAKWIEENLPEAWFRPMFQYSESEMTQMLANKRK